MTRVRYSSGIDFGRLKLDNRYVWLDFHDYCGPSFFRDSAMSKVYEPEGENDPIWPVFEQWLTKYRAAKEKQQQQLARRQSNGR